MAETKSKRVSVSLTVTEYQRLTEIASEQNVSISQLCGEAVRKEILALLKRAVGPNEKGF